MTTKLLRVRLVAALLVVLLGPARFLGGAEDASGGAILDTFSFWRCHYTYLPEVLRDPSGELKTIREAQIGVGKETFTVEMPVSEPPPSDWTGVDFDDGSWIREPGPFGSIAYYNSGFADRNADPPLRLICLRGRFDVLDTEKAGSLSLSATYHGGIVVYLNGRELARGHMPEGKIEADTLAEIYADEAYVDEKGKLRTRGAEQHDRHIKDLAIPASLLRKGTNVLGIELHRPPTPAIWNEANPSRSDYGYDYWAMVGLDDLRLVARAASAAVVSNASRPAKLCVRTANALFDLHDRDYPDPNEPLRPIVLAGARNGRFGGQIAISAPGAIRECSVVATDLARRGGGIIPKTCVLIRYALPDGVPNEWQTRVSRYRIEGDGKKPGKGAGLRRFDALEEPPCPEAPAGADGGATLPVWVTVLVPRDAAGGAYNGQVSVGVNGAAPVNVPVELHVAEYTLPDPRDFESLLNIVHSPDTVAVKYSVGLWTEEHWKLEEQALKLLGQSGSRAMYIHLICGTHHGNEQSTLRWVKKGDGTYDYDFSIVDRYLDLAAKYLNRRRPLLCFYVYDPVSAYGKAGASTCIPLKVSVLDTNGGAPGTMDAPAWDSPESAPFWKPVFAALRKRCESRGLLGAMAVGMAGQGDPSKAAMNVLNEVIPEAGWVRVQHPYTAEMAGKPCADSGTVYVPPGNMFYVPHKRFSGWKDTSRTITYFPRGWWPVALSDASPTASYQLFTEALQCTGYQGFSWIGADFWDVGDKSGKEGVRGRARTLLKPNWGQLALCARGGGWSERKSAFFGAGRAGPVSTVRYEILCEGLQETEARIFMERALSDPERSKRMGKALCARCQNLLDDRVRALDIGLGIKSDKARKFFKQMDKTIEDRRMWYAATVSARSAELYAAAAEVEKKLGGR